MIVKKISEQLLNAFGPEHAKSRKYIATTDGTVGCGFAYGETIEEAIENLKKMNNKTN